MCIPSRILGFILAATALSYAAAQQSAPAELFIQSTIPKSAAHIAYGFDALWAMSGGNLVRINNADSNIVEIKLPIGENAGLLSELDRYRGIAVGEGAIWVPEMASSTILKIDPETNKLALTIPTDIFGSQGGVGVGLGSVWVITFDTRDKTLTRYNADSGAVEERIGLPNAGRGVLVAYGSVWVTAANRGELYQIDPQTKQIAATIALHDASNSLAAAEGSIWILFDEDGVVQRIDGKTGEVLATIRIGTSDMESDGDISTGGGYVWTINRGSIVGQIDARTNSAIGTFRPPAGINAGRRIRYGGDSLWLSGSAIFRVLPPN